MDSRQWFIIILIRKLEKPALIQGPGLLYLVRLKTKVDDLDVDKLETFSIDLSKLSNVVDSDVVKITVYDGMVIKLNAIDLMNTKH